MDGGEEGVVMHALEIATVSRRQLAPTRGAGVARSTARGWDETTHAKEFQFTSSAFQFSLAVPSREKLRSDATDDVGAN